jgi:hypothetical protein
MALNISPQQASDFIKSRAAGFRKDIAICQRGLSPKYLRQWLPHGPWPRHAYFPALMTCFSFLEFLSGYRAGNIKAYGGPSVKQIKEFSGKYLDCVKYKEPIIDILWEGFRNKLAHLYHPGFVFDTSKSKKIPNKNMRITWKISEKSTDRHLELEPKDHGLKKDLILWVELRYDHVLHISIPSFREDLLKAASCYSNDLLKDTKLLENFEKAIKDMIAFRIEQN